MEKKSLVGWTHKDWKEGLYFNRNYTRIAEVEMVKRKNLLMGDRTKIRVTIEEIK